MAEMRTLTINDVKYDIVDANAVKFVEQELTDAQKAQARANIGASSANGEITVPEYWVSSLEEAEQKITELQSEGGVDVFTFGFITDTHTDVNSNGNFAKLMEHVIEKCNIPLFLHGGDYIAGHGIISKDDLIAQHLHHDDIFRNIEDKMLTSQGNHESVYGITEYYDSNLSNEETYNYVFRKNQSKYNIVFGDTGTYFYKDIPAQKVRYIILNCYEFETKMDENQTVIENNKLRVAKLGTKQLTWLANIALDVPENWSVIICSHNAPYRMTDIPESWRTETTAMLDCEVTLGIVKAFRNKTTYSYSGTLGSGTTAENYNLNFDFSQKHGNIICWVSGHTHMDGMFDIDGLNVVVTANCSLHVAVVDAPSKTQGTDTEYIMDFFCVDKKKRICNIVRLGADLGNNSILKSYTNRADTNDENFLPNKRINASNAIVDADGFAITNYIPFSNGDILHLKGFELRHNYIIMEFYNGSGSRLTWLQYMSTSASISISDYDDSVICFDSKTEFGNSGTGNAIKRIRISAPLTGSIEDVVVTTNENIQATECEGRAFDY